MRAIVFTVAVLVFGATPVLAQEGSVEDRLREALRKSTVELRALQDSQGVMQAQLQQATQQRDMLQAKVNELSAKEPAAPAPQASAPDRSAEVRALQEQVRSMQAALGKYQASYNEAAGVARAKDAESKQEAERAKSAGTRIERCVAENAKLVDVANDILHLYRSQHFHTILLGSYEPVLGMKQVELQTIVQDYEDKIADHDVRALPVSGEPAQGARP